MPFSENNSNGVVYMTADFLGARHAFTTRFGGVSGGVYSSLNLGENRGDEAENVIENHRRLFDALELDPSRKVFTRQVHGAEVRTVTEADAHELFAPIPYEADGLVTNVPGLALVIFIADCVPVLLCDREAGVVAAVHCGWRGTVGDILGAALEKMCGLGARPESIRAAVGPSIGYCCFETGPEVPGAIDELLSGETQGLIRQGANYGKCMVDLRGVNARRLTQLGLSKANIEVSGECTMCMSEKYWSHRATGGVRGSQAAVIAL